MKVNGLSGWIQVNALGVLPGKVSLRSHARYLFECRIEGGSGVKPRMDGDAGDIFVAEIRMDQQPFRLRYPQFVDVLVKILPEALVEHERQFMGADAYLFGVRRQIE